MWSGPRNLSTAMMYAFAQRRDFDVMDEPFYAAYLRETGAPHPMRDDIIAAHDADADAVARRIADHGDARHLYLKVMPHHMVRDFPLDWAADCTNVHLIRHPARVVASYAEKTGTVRLEDIGFDRQLAVFKRFPGPVTSSEAVRADPEGALRALCAATGIEFDADMLTWPEGGRPEDGVWATHWYGAIHGSTGFAGAEGPIPSVSGELADLVDAAMSAYEALLRHHI